MKDNSQVKNICDTGGMVESRSTFHLLAMRTSCGISSLVGEPRSFSEELVKTFVVLNLSHQGCIHCESTSYNYKIDFEIHPHFVKEGSYF